MQVHSTGKKDEYPRTPPSYVHDDISSQRSPAEDESRSVLVPAQEIRLSFFSPTKLKECFVHNQDRKNFDEMIQEREREIAMV